MDEARDFRLNEGLTCTFSTVELQPIGFSIAGEHMDPDPRERAALEFIAVYALGCAISLSEVRSAERVHLSPRQHDVLRWAAEGLKNEDIAERLCISVHTADMHLRAVRQKLGVANTVHAVAEALRLGIIS
jgi:LuxR family quorum sensing-dependent transcriptional regulator